ncbi:MAG TPA: hypothetical protein VN924_10990 [Bryobacteraceae bacterium]|jgi:hypothetical protein|nr:hypothetical protein [Bryobacteraceae bacterium]
MSRLLDIQEHLLNNAAEIARLERALGHHPSRALSSSLKSLYKLRSGLEAEFREAAAADQVDVVTYRLFDGRQPTMASVGRAMDSFQTLYAVLYSAIVNAKPKDTAHLSSAVIQQSSFDFSYAFSGSVGFVFTIPNERLLLGETRLDEAMNQLFAMAKCSTTGEVKDFARKVGRAPVRAIYDWVDALSGSDAGADLQWKKDDSAKGSLLLQPAQAQALRDLISQTSDLEIDENRFHGLLLGFDSKTRMFRFDPSEGGTIIRGKIAEDADMPPTVEIPRRYIARVKTATRVRYSTEQPEITHTLLGLS